MIYNAAYNGRVLAELIVVLSGTGLTEEEEKSNEGWKCFLKVWSGAT